MAVKLIVDRSACTGHGRCYELAPEVFEADDEGYSVVKRAEVPPALEEPARLAERSCPERAIRVVPEAHR
jgi:ferredoxin